MFDRDFRRALRFIVPYWRRLALVLALGFGLDVERRADRIITIAGARVVEPAF